VVNAGGDLNMPNETGFDQPRINSFFEALYKTNIAGIESMHVGAAVVNRMQNMLEQSNKKMSLVREELISVNKSIESLAAQKGSSNASVDKLGRLRKQAEALADSLNDEKNRQMVSSRIKDRAATVVDNGRSAAKSTYEIASQMSTFAGKGLNAVTSPFRAFLLGRRWLFIPHTVAVNEDDLYDWIIKESNDLSKYSGLMDWTSTGFQVTSLPDQSMKIEDTPINLFLKTKPEHPQIQPRFVMLSSNALLGDRNATLYSTSLTPFDNRAITSSQRFYLAPQCLKSGLRKDVTWTVLARDLVYSFEEGSGQPMLSFSPRWCLELGIDAETCPGLSAEFQIRSPIPSFNAGISGFYLQDPYGGASVALYPPMPIELI
jgi:hypothetical protein